MKHSGYQWNDEIALTKLLVNEMTIRQSDITSKPSTVHLNNNSR
jgi:hypothetical protein